MLRRVAVCCSVLHTQRVKCNDTSISLSVLYLSYALSLSLSLFLSFSFSFPLSVSRNLSRLLNPFLCPSLSVSLFDTRYIIVTHTWKHTTTHRNTLQRAATLCNTMQSVTPNERLIHWIRWRMFAMWCYIIFIWCQIFSIWCNMFFICSRIFDLISHIVYFWCRTFSIFFAEFRFTYLLLSSPSPTHTQIVPITHTYTGGCYFCCFIRNSLVALPEALFSRILKDLRSRCDIKNMLLALCIKICP